MSQPRKRRPTLSLHPKTAARDHASTPAGIDYAHFGKRLRERSQVLRGEIRDTLLRSDVEQYAEIADRIGDVEDRPLAELLADVSHAEVMRDAEEAGDIETALKRIAAGTYGVCLQCHTPIPRERLEAHPTAKRCLPCQQRYEQP